MHFSQGMSKIALYGVAFVGLIGGIAAVADALVVTEREQLESFADAVTGQVSSKRIDAALRYADPSMEPIDVMSLDGRWSFDAENAARLAAKVRTTLAPLEGTTVRVVQKSVQIENGNGRVALRLSTSEGLVNVTFSLRRHENRWLVRRAVVS